MRSKSKNIGTATMRRFQAVVAMTAGLLLIGTGAVAHVPTVTITAPTNGDLIQVETAEFPYNLPVAGTVSHDPGTVKLTVSVNGVEAFSDQWQNVTNQAWGFNYTVSTPGTYTISASAVHGRDSADDSVSVEVEEITQVVVVDYPAAPSVVGKILKEEGVPARYGSGKSGGNWISDVAHHMGPQTDFDGISKSDAAKYEAAVRAFLVAAGAL